MVVSGRVCLCLVCAGVAYVCVAFTERALVCSFALRLCSGRLLSVQGRVDEIEEWIHAVVVDELGALRLWQVEVHQEERLQISPKFFTNPRFKLTLALAQPATGFLTSSVFFDRPAAALTTVRCIFEDTFGSDISSDRGRDLTD
ncbi:hypothetical protein WR25_25386 [Diploscapter pachys]|uniref:Uncharacterized protein n=1 Tax=Diploscapter pachys TaxID=2018661 RepID=A0A2A2JRN9_9BILA|nr:hypothetical protein WR25_25386 [Diploscapter pachys]